MSETTNMEVTEDGEHPKPMFGSFSFDPTDNHQVLSHYAKATQEVGFLRAKLAEKETKDVSKKFNNITIKVPLPPSFNGTDGVPVSINLSRLDILSYLNSHHCPPCDLVSHAKRFLSGHAWKAYQSQELLEKSKGTKLDVNNWEFFEKITNQLFRHIDSEQVARDALYSLVQTESAEKYLQEFQGFVAQIRRFPLFEGDMMDHFKRGLKPALRQLVVLDPRTGKPWESFLKFTSYACRVDGQMVQNNSSASLFDVDTQDRPPKSGKGKRERDESPDALGKLLDLATMLKGQTIGNFGSRKRQKGPTIAGPRIGTGAGGRTPGRAPMAMGRSFWRNILCFICKQSGHQAKECRNRNVSN